MEEVVVEEEAPVGGESEGRASDGAENREEEEEEEEATRRTGDGRETVRRGVGLTKGQPSRESSGKWRRQRGGRRSGLAHRNPGRRLEFADPAPTDRN